MMVAIPDYLAAVSGVEGDVLLVSTEQSGGFVTGLPGSEIDFESPFGSIKEFVRQGNYKDIKIVGVSGGTVPALTASADLHPSAVLVVGPPPGHISSYGEELIRQLKKQPGLGATRYIFAFGSDSKDREAASFLSLSLGGDTLVVEGAGHGAMRELIEQFSLEQMLLGSPIRNG
jgi:hypothetical protein